MNSIELKTSFPIISFSTFIYAIFYTFCFYQNHASITYPIFVIATLLFFYFISKHFSMHLKKRLAFYGIGMFLLSYSTFISNDGTLHFFNALGIILLLICMLLHQLYDDFNWGFLTHIRNIFATLTGCFSCLFASFSDCYHFITSEEKHKFQQVIYLIIGLSISIPIVFVMASLLISSDYIMLNIATDLFSQVSLNDLFGITFTTIAMFVFTYAWLTYLLKGTLRTNVTKLKRSNPIIILSVTLPLTLLYLFYSGIQILYLFLGNLALPNDYTYAEYAREGFFQLLVVCAFNLILVLVAIHLFQRSNFVNAILTCISLCTYIMLISSGIRMIMYIRFYYMTYLRILVLWALVVLFFILSGTVCSIYKQNFPLFRYAMLTVTICYFALSFSKPDYVIAKINCANIDTVSSDFFLDDPYTDFLYLSTLSLDAAPIVHPIMEEIHTAENYLYTLASDRWFKRYTNATEHLNFRSYNLSVANAKSLH
ncbi:MAG: DUF4173 domain-containing protein [Eubacteriales bacterium]